MRDEIGNGRSRTLNSQRISSTGLIGPAYGSPRPVRSVNDRVGPAALALGLHEDRAIGVVDDRDGLAGDVGAVAGHVVERPAAVAGGVADTIRRRRKSRRGNGTQPNLGHKAKFIF